MKCFICNSEQVNFCICQGLLLCDSHKLTNSWLLDQKFQYLDSFDIPLFKGMFGPGEYYREYIKDIKFSSELKYSFVCKNHIGILK